MYSKAKIAGHPIHPMLIAFPVAFYAATLVSLIVYGANEDPFWFRTAVVANAAGVIMAAVAAVPGLIDFVAGIPRGTRAAGTALRHALLNVSALVLFVVNFFYIREGWRGDIPSENVAIVLSALGVLATLGAGWFGWKLVQKHHVGVEPLSAEDYAEATGAKRADVETRHVGPPHPQAR